MRGCVWPARTQNQGQPVWNERRVPHQGQGCPMITVTVTITMTLQITVVVAVHSNAAIKERIGNE